MPDNQDYSEYKKVEAQFQAEGGRILDLVDDLSLTTRNETFTRDQMRQLKHAMEERLDDQP
ncbi:MAG: hypothetical protein SV186_00525 [Candidatus Nanohaloarchaea archaeon]|nr:hypothetical protein [Candidatus Nanohaloarchaea archaeon]